MNRNQITITVDEKKTDHLLDRLEALLIRFEAAIEKLAGYRVEADAPIHIAIDVDEWRRVIAKRNKGDNDDQQKAGG